MKNNTTNKNTIALINEYQHYYLVGTILPIMVLMWAQYEKTPDIKYIKLFSFLISDLFSFKTKTGFFSKQHSSLLIQFFPPSLIF